jgi:acyl-CoA synthetase (NDP forming)
MNTKGDLAGEKPPPAGGLDALFQPRSIAFIGASERSTAPASRGLRHCVRLGFKGRLYPINPKHQNLFGVACHPSLASVPGPVDLAMIALSAEATLDAVTACKEAGVRVVIACSSGWEETGSAEGEARAARLRQLMAGSRMRLLGPNCLGSGNPAIGMCLAYNSSFESISFPRRGRIGLVTQSGAMLGGIILNGEDMGADLALFAHVGNAMDIGLEEIMEHMVRDPQISVLALMIEGVREPDRFVTAARLAREQGKPVVVFKAGASELGRQAVKSHTGALAGSDEVFSAVCRELGVIRVDEPEDLMPTASLLASWEKKSPVRDGKLLVFTLSGGAASIIADECSTVGVSLPPLQQATLARLKPILPAYTTAGNPFDVGGGVFSDPDLPRKTLAIAALDDNAEAVLWVGVGAPRDERSRALLDQAVDFFHECKKPAAIIPLSGHPEEAGFDRARALGIPVLRSLHAAVTSIAAAGMAHRAVVAAGQPGRDLPDLPEGDVIDELRSKEVLSRLGIPVPPFRRAGNASEVAAVATDIGFPVVVKGMAHGVAHKSELGLVALGLASAEAAREAAERMARRSDGLALSGFLVEKMAGKGVEVVLGIKRDPQFGPVLMFGLGGIAVELFSDVAFGRCPLSPEGAEAVIGLTRAAKLLRGYRGQPRADEKALVQAMVRLSQFAAKHADVLEEMDVNPLIVLPEGQGVVAVDAVMIRRS